MNHLLRVLTGCLLLTPLSALAHETHQYRIGGGEYRFVVGSLNEPVVVDDKTGVELRVSLIDGSEAGLPIEGLEKTLKVELGAGDQKKELPLATQFGVPGAYKANFFPTVQTTYTYRFFGEVNGEQIDLTFSCNPAGHPATPEDMTKVEVSGNVTRTLKRGAFGCPTGKADLGFPEPSATIEELRSGRGSMGMVGLVAGLLGLVAGAGAWMKVSRRG